MYSTHGLMTPADQADYVKLYDFDVWKDETDPQCPGHFVRGQKFNEVARIEYCTFRDLCPQA